MTGTAARETKTLDAAGEATSLASNKEPSTLALNEAGSPIPEVKVRAAVDAAEEFEKGPAPAADAAALLRLVWPPTKEDLQHLYVDMRLSAAKIAL